MKLVTAQGDRLAPDHQTANAECDAIYIDS